jgi:hypothetical protein
VTAIPTGACRYSYNPSETYQRTRPGYGVETHCGAITFAALDDPEIVALTQPDGTVKFAHTGRMLPRSYPDPYCEFHGGTPEPPAPPVSVAELEAAHTAYVELAGRFQMQAGGALTAAVEAPAELAAAPAELAAAPDEPGGQAADVAEVPLAAAFGTETNPGA